MKAAATSAPAPAAAGRMLEHDWYPQLVPDNVIIGQRSHLYSSYALLHFRSRRPVGVKIGHDTGVYVETYFDLGPNGQVTIGDYCTLAGPIFCTDGRVTIGNHVLISREVVIGEQPFASPPISKSEDSSPSEQPADIEIGNDAWIGTRAVLLAGARIGQGAIIGAAAVVDIEVPPFAIVAGNPAKIVGWARPSSLKVVS